MPGEIVTVFGGTGYLGSAIVRALHSNGARVRVAARRADHDNIAGLPESVTAVRADVRDEVSLEAALAGSRAAINAVGLYVEKDDETFESVHVRGAASIARLAARAGVDRLTHISGIGASASAASSYVRARAAGEHAVLEHFPHATVVRPSVLFGPDDGFLSAIDAITRRSPIFPLFGRGATRMQPVFVEDVADAVVKTLEQPGVRARLCELGGPHILTYRQIVKAVLHFRGRRRVLLPVPFWVWRLQASALALVMNPPVTADQVILMRNDNVVARDVVSFGDLGITPRDLEALLPWCLEKRNAEKTSC
jgi:uncharacterized protein YbjT (DUF2867 family)